MKKLTRSFCMLCAVAVSLVSRGAVADETAPEKLNSLLRGELSAVETYRQALRKVGNEPEADKVRSMLKDHEDSVAKLRSEVIKQGATPSTDSGAWGAWAKTVTGSAKIFGDEAALKALHEGEKHGLDSYEEAMNHKAIAPETKTLIKDVLIPRQRQHIGTLDGLMERL